MAQQPDYYSPEDMGLDLANIFEGMGDDDYSAYDPATYFDSSLFGIPQEGYDAEESKRKWWEGIPKRQAGFWETFKSGIFSPTQILKSIGYATSDEADRDTARNTLLQLGQETNEGERTSFEEALPFDVLGNPTDKPFKISKFVNYMKQMAGNSFGFQAAPVAATWLTKAALGAAKLTPAGRALSYASYIFTAGLQYIGGNAERTAAENQKRIETGDPADPPISPSLSKIVFAAGGQALADRLVFAIKPLNVLLGGAGKAASKELTEEVLNKATKDPSLLTGAIGSGLKVGALEMPQELTQSMLERWQAGLSTDFINDEGARKEAVEAAVGGFLLGAPLGTTTRILENGLATPEDAPSEVVPVGGSIVPVGSSTVSSEDITDDPLKDSGAVTDVEKEIATLKKFSENTKKNLGFAPEDNKNAEENSQKITTEIENTVNEENLTEKDRAGLLKTLTSTLAEVRAQTVKERDEAVKLDVDKEAKKLEEGIDQLNQEVMGVGLIVGPPKPSELGTEGMTAFTEKLQRKSETLDEPVVQPFVNFIRDLRSNYKGTDERFKNLYTTASKLIANDENLTPSELIAKIRKSIKQYAPDSTNTKIAEQNKFSKDEYETALQILRDKETVLEIQDQTGSVLTPEEIAGSIRLSQPRLTKEQEQLKQGYDALQVEIDRANASRPDSSKESKDILGRRATKYAKDNKISLEKALKEVKKIADKKANDTIKKVEQKIEELAKSAGFENKKGLKNSFRFTDAEGKELFTFDKSPLSVRRNQLDRIVNDAIARLVREFKNVNTKGASRLAQEKTPEEVNKIWNDIVKEYEGKKLPPNVERTIKSLKELEKAKREQQSLLEFQTKLSEAQRRIKNTLAANNLKALEDGIFVAPESTLNYQVSSYLLQKVSTNEFKEKGFKSLPLADQKFALTVSKQLEMADSLSPIAIEAINNNDLTGALREIAKQTKVPTIAAFARRLAALNMPVSVAYGNPVVKEERVRGLYNANTDGILLDLDKGNDVHTLLHEATHAAVVNFIPLNDKGELDLRKVNALTNKRQKRFAKQIDAIFKEALPYLNINSYRQATMNLNEFIAEFVSNEDIQNRLREVKSTKLPDRSLFQVIIDALKRVVYFITGQRKGISLFDQATVTMDAALSMPFTEKSIPSIAQHALNDQVKEATFGVMANNMNMGMSPKTSGKEILRKFDGLPVSMQNVLTKFLPLFSLTKFANQYFPPSDPATETKDNVSLQTRSARINDLVGEKSAFENMQREKVEAVDKRLREAFKDNSDAFGRAGELAVEATMAGLNPRYKEGTLEYEKMKRKILTSPELYGPWEENDGPSLGAKDLHAELRKKYLALPELQRDSYEAVENSLQTLWDQVLGLIEPAVKRLPGLAPDAQDGLINKLRQEILDKANLDPYFALTREGDYRLSYLSTTEKYNQENVAGQAVRVIEFFKTRAERESKIKEVQSEIMQSLSKESQAQVQRVNQFMADNEVIPEMFNKKDSPELTAQQRRSLEELEVLYGNLKQPEKNAVSGINGIIKFTSASDIRGKLDINKISSDALLRRLLETFDANKPRRPVTESAETTAEYEAQTNLYARQRDDFINTLLDTMPEVMLAGNVRRRRMPGYLGASTDLRDSFIKAANGLITKISNMKYNPEMDFQIEQMEQKIKTDESSNRSLLYPAGTEQAKNMVGRLKKSVNFAKDPTLHDLTNFFTSASFFMMMGYNLSSAAIQTTQVPLVIAPKLGGEYGFVNAAGAMGRSTKYIMSSGRSKTITDLSGKETQVKSSYSMLNHSKEHLAKVDNQIGMQAGVLDTVFNSLRAKNHIGTSTMFEYLNLNKLDTASLAASSKDKLGSLRSLIMRYSGVLFNATEQFNREVTALSIVQLEVDKMRKDRKIKKGDTLNLTESEIENIIRKASDGIQELNGATSMGGTAQITQGNVTKVLFIFKNFGLAMYSMLFGTMYRALPTSLTGEEGRRAAIARKQLAGMYGASALMAGMHGIPLFWVPELVYEAFREDGEDDLETLTRKYFGEAPIDKFTGLSISTRAGWADLVVRDTDYYRNLGVVDKVMAGLGGAPYSIFKKLEQGSKDLTEGRYTRAVENFSPLFMTNPAKTFRFVTEDGARTRRGDLMVGDFSPYHLTMQALGFSYKPLIMRTERNAYIKEKETTLGNKASRLLSRLYLSQRTYDTSTYYDTYQDLMELNIEYPQLGLTPSSIRKRMEMRDRISDEMYYGISIGKRWRSTLIPDAEELQLGTENNFLGLFD
mgnify:CR=1 FL=1